MTNRDTGQENDHIDPTETHNADYYYGRGYLIPEQELLGEFWNGGLLVLRPEHANPKVEQGTYKIERWLREQPEKMVELHCLIEREKPDIVIFLDTSARPTGKLYGYFRDWISDLTRRPAIEFIAPPDREYEQKLNTAEAIKYRRKFTESIGRRFLNPHYRGKKIMIVDESTQTGEQAGLIKTNLNASGYENKVVLVSLGKDDSAESDNTQSRQLRTFDYILGYASIPPWSKHSQALDRDKTEVLSVAKADLSDTKSWDDSKVNPTAKPNPNTSPKMLRDFYEDLRTVAGYCYQYYRKVGEHKSIAVYTGDVRHVYDLGELDERGALVSYMVSQAKDIPANEVGNFILSLDSVWPYLHARGHLHELSPVIKQVLEQQFSSDKLYQFLARKCRYLEFMIQKEFEREVLQP